MHVLGITNSWSKYHFNGHVFNISGNCEVHMFPQEALSDDYILPQTLIELYATCHLWTSNMTSCKNVVSLRVLCKYVNFDSTRGSTGRDRCGSWIYNYICSQCLSPLPLWDRNSLRRGVLDTTLCDKVCQWLAAGQCFSPGTPVSSINKTDRHHTHLTEILLKWR